MTDAELKTSHEDVVTAIRKKLLGLISTDRPNSTWADDVLKLAQAYERIESAGLAY